MRELMTARNLHCAVTVLEREPKRMAALQQIGQRLQHVPQDSAQTTDRFIIGDAATLDWWDGEPFALILLDAPCSGTGTIRRHPEIKIQLTPTAVAEHQALQLQILSSLWHVLAQGGTLLYCTCSVLSAENDTVIDRFLGQVGGGNDNNANINEMPIVLPIRLATGAPTRHGWQLLPTQPDTDGFYYALIGKRHS
jgi:16S rRNA (cytosine967-C5)-methyltransferase